MILYIWGDDDFRSREFLKKSITEFRAKRDPAGYNTAILDAARESAAKMLGEVFAAPFLSEKRMVVLQNALANHDADTLRALAEAVQGRKVPESSVVIFWQGEKPAKTAEAKKLAELLAKEQYSFEFKLLSQAEKAAWAIKTAAERGGKISMAAAAYLAANVEDMWFLNSVIDQLAAYCADREAETADCELFLEEKSDDNIFGMAEAVAAGDRRRAYKLINDQRRLGQDDGYLFNMIARQFKILLNMRDLFEREENLTSDDYARRLGIHPFAAKKTLPLARRFTFARLTEIYRDILDIDIKTKTGVANQGVLIDLFVGKI